MSRNVDAERDIEALRAAHAAELEALRRLQRRERVKWEQTLDALGRRMADERLRMAAELDRVSGARGVRLARRTKAALRRIDALAMSRTGHGRGALAAAYLRAREYLRRWLS